MKRGEEEARSLSDLLEQQRSRIAKAAKDFNPNQLTLDLVPEERREREADRRHWEGRLNAPRTRAARRAAASARILRSTRASARTGRPRLSLAGFRMSAMATDLNRDPDLEWLDHVQPVGLVVAPSLLKELGLSPLRQTPIDTGAVAELLAPDTSQARAPRPLGLRGTGARLGGAAMSPARPGGPAIPDDLLVALPEHDTDARAQPGRSPSSATAAAWQLLVRVEAAGVDPDERGALDGWEATPHQRFERLLARHGYLRWLVDHGHGAAADLRAERRDLAAI